MRRHGDEIDLAVMRILGAGLQLLRALRGADEVLVGLEQLAQACLVLGERRVGALAGVARCLGRRAQLGVEAVFFDDLAAERVAARPGSLGAVHGGVGAVDERHRIGAVFRIDADAEAARERQRVRADLRRRGQ